MRTKVVLTTMVAAGALAFAGCGSGGQDVQVQKDLTNLLETHGNMSTIKECTHGDGNHWICKAKTFGPTPHTVFWNVTDDGHSIYAQIAP